MFGPCQVAMLCGDSNGDLLGKSQPNMLDFSAEGDHLIILLVANFSLKLFQWLGYLLVLEDSLYEMVDH